MTVAYYVALVQISLTKKPKTNFTKISCESLYDDLKNFDWSELCNMTDVSEATQFLIAKVKSH